MSKKVKKKPWKKILYENQGYPDNYTDETFLLEKKNIKPAAIKLYDAILGASLLVQELCTVIIFFLIYFYLYNEWVDPTLVLYCTSILTGLSFMVYRKFYSSSLTEKFGDDVRTLLIFIVFGYLFSPVLHTLTDTISTDTIYAMTFFMMLVHLIFFDYGIPAAVVSNSFSLSAAVFGSICLASRLASAHHAFVLITIAIKMFVLFPLLRQKIRKSIVMTLFLTIVTIYVLMQITSVMSILFICALVLINIVCPTLFVWNQTCKDNIYGPWDEAIVVDADDINDLIYS